MSGKKETLTGPLLKKGHIHQSLKDIIEDNLCPNCHGHGSVTVTGMHPNTNEIKKIDCPICLGTGELYK